jgi:hypothetical protein
VDPLPLPRDWIFLFYILAAFLNWGASDCSDWMQVMPIDAAKEVEPKLSFSVKFVGLAARTLVILALAVLTAEVASPQIEHIWTLQETPDDLIRVALGFALCVWCIINLFILPKDAEAYRTWIYLGLVVLPFAALCVFVVW